jgi:hypothetical protein
MGVRFPATWCAPGLGRYRPCRATYERYPYDSLPALDEQHFTGSHRWFADPGAVTAEHTANMDALRLALSELGLALPQDFITFQTHSGLRRALDDVSVTGCWTDVSRPMASPVEPGAYLVRFLRDQQDSAIWYLYLRPEGEVFVVHSYDLARHLDYLDPAEGWDPDDEAPELSLEALTGEIFWCAPSFEEFAYRFWIENRLWHALHDDDNDLDVAQRRYLDHYSPTPRSAT